MFAEILRFKYIGKRMLQEDDVVYLEKTSRHFCQHFMRRTTQQTFLVKKTRNKLKPYFSSF